jgi:hypothetical protein
MEGSRVRRNGIVLGLLMIGPILSACAHGVVDPAPNSRPPALSADAVPHSKTDFSVLSLQRVTSGSLEAASLAALLERAKYRGGTERSFVSRSSPLDRTVTRVLEFSRDDGARVYLGWAESHPADLIGDAKGGAPLDLPGSPDVFVHTPNGCCAKDVPKSLAVWQRDRYVLLVIANGGMAKQKTLTDLAAQLDGLV